VGAIDQAQSFFILGAMKCGTSTLYRYLAQHPDVFLSHPKEPVFYEAQFERGMDFYRRHYFGAWSGQHAVGEARTHNLFLPYVAERIRKTLPDARLVAILRDPTPRAHSEWWHQYSRGLETLPFDRAVQEDLRRVEQGVTFEGPEGERLWRAGLHTGRDARTRYGLYLQMGYYARQLARYRALFPPDQLRVLFFQDLERDPERVVRATWKHLGVDPDVPLRPLASQNTARTRARSPLAARLNMLPGPRGWARYLPEALRRPVRRFLAGRPMARPPMDPEVEAWLRQHFAPHNRALEALVGRALPEWSRPRSTAADGKDPR